MVHLTPNQQSDEIRDLEYFLKGYDDLAIVELQTQQIKRLIFFAKKGLTAHRTRPPTNNKQEGEMDEQ
jgi:hypothetical protein